MNLPGINKLTMTEECLRMALEDMVNATRREGEDYVHVVAVNTHYGTGGATLDLTTDPQPIIPTGEVTEAS